MNNLYQAALKVQAFFQERHWRFCLLGGLAVIRWGRPRATQDVDLTLLTGLGSEESYIDELLAHFESRVSEARDFALDARVLLLRGSNGAPIDVALGGIWFEEDMVNRATPFAYAPGVSLVTCSAEDLVVSKAFADRAGDWLDIEGVLVRQKGKLDWPYIVAQLERLCELKEAPEILKRLDHVRKTAEDG